jgi:microcystin-dependent protein
MAIQSRNYFFTPTVNTERFLSQDEPTEQVMRNFADSVTFKVEVSDTATETQQGLVETATQNEYDNGIDNNANGFALYVRPSMIKTALDTVTTYFQNAIDIIQNTITSIQGDITDIQGDIVNIENAATENMPVGSMILYPVSTPPNAKWLKCEGQTLDNTLYPDLFAVIGYNYGGSGVNFSLPDLRKKFVAGFDDGDPEYQNIGSGAGANSVTLTENQTAVPGHTHVINFRSVDSNPSTGDTDAKESIQNDGLHTHAATTTVTIDPVSGAPASEAHENRPDFVAFPWMMKIMN